MQTLRTKRHVCPADGLAPGEGRFFDGVVRGQLRPCFAVRLPGPGDEPRFAAFLNVCAHRNQPVAVNAHPFDPQGFLECQAHGARFEAPSGVCVEGPCVGARLVSVEVEAVDGQLYAIDGDEVDDSLYDDD